MEQIKEYVIGEEVEVLMIVDGKEEWKKTVIYDYDCKKNEYGYLVRYGIKPENVRKLKKDMKRRLIKHENYFSSHSGFYVDKELGINVSCQVFSCDEYEEGIKEYKINYKNKDNKNIIRIVNANKIEDVFLPIIGYEAE